jgi:methionyl-tRNA formyltransferase
MLKSLVFLGSGPLALSSLESLAASFEIEAIITKTKPTWHKEPAPVEEYSINNSKKLLFANNPAELQNLLTSNNLLSSLAVVVDYGVIIPKAFISYFKKGVINSHFSLLPEWKGADPITYSLLSGQSKTGVSIMLIDQGLDTGPILCSQSIVPTKEDNNQSLSKKLSQLNNLLLPKTIESYLESKLYPKSQTRNVATYSTKIRKNDGLIDFNKPATHILREIRAYANWPKSWLMLNNKRFVITDAQESNKVIKKGSFKIIDSKLLIGFRIGAISVTKIKPEGKPEMDINAFINGYKKFFI